MVTKLELVANALALLAVLYPMTEWVFSLLQGRIVDVAGPWWFLWLSAYTLVVGWTAVVGYRLVGNGS